MSCFFLTREYNYHLGHIAGCLGYLLGMWFLPMSLNNIYITGLVVYQGVRLEVIVMFT